MSTNSYISKSLVTIVDFHKISHHHGIGLQSLPLFFWLFCTGYNFKDFYGNLGTGNGNVSSIHASSSFAIISIRITIVSSISSISSIGRVGSMGIGISTMPVGGSNDSSSRCYRSNSWDSFNL